MVNGVKTPDLTGSAFRFVYRVPDPARPASPRTNNNTPPIEDLINRVMNVYTSSPITLRWDAASRTYVATQPFTGVVRAAFVDEAVIADISRDDPTALRFRAIEAALYRYKDEYPTAGEVTAQYDGGATATVHFHWTTANMSGATPDGDNLLMTAFDATQTPSLQGASKVARARLLQQLRPHERHGRRPVDATAGRAGDPARPGARPVAQAVVRLRQRSRTPTSRASLRCCRPRRPTRRASSRTATTSRTPAASTSRTSRGSR